MPIDHGSKLGLREQKGEELRIIGEGSKARITFLVFEEVGKRGRITCVKVSFIEVLHMHVEYESL